MQSASGIPWGDVALKALILAGGVVCAKLIVDAGVRKLEEGIIAAGESFCKGRATAFEETAKAYTHVDTSSCKTTSSPSILESLGDSMKKAALLHAAVLGGFEILAACMSRRRFK